MRALNSRGTSHALHPNYSAASSGFKEVGTCKVQTPRGTHNFS